jgi:glycine/D-amino acid oxidase-like deaminating enzyme
VQAAGAQVVPRCAVQGIERDGARFKLTTARGTTLARDVVVATNGYTGPLTPWLRRHGLGRLPGDVQLHWRGRQWQLPIASTLLLSAAATLLGRLF